MPEEQQCRPKPGAGPQFRLDDGFGVVAEHLDERRVHPTHDRLALDELELDDGKSVEEYSSIETLLKAIRHKDKFQRGTNLRAWLFTIMRNTFFNKRAKRRRERPGKADCVSDTPWTAPTQEWSVRGSEVLDAVNRLPLHYREIFILVVMLGESYETSAEICQIAMGTVKSRVNRARAMVIEDLGDEEL